MVVRNEQYVSSWENFCVTEVGVLQVMILGELCNFAGMLHVYSSISNQV